MYLLSDVTPIYSLSNSKLLIVVYFHNIVIRVVLFLSDKESEEMLSSFFFLMKFSLTTGLFCSAGEMEELLSSFFLLDFFFVFFLTCFGELLDSFFSTFYGHQTFYKPEMINL